MDKLSIFATNTIDLSVVCLLYQFLSDNWEHANILNLRWTFQDLDYLWLTLVDAESAALWFYNIRADKGTRWNDNRAGALPVLLFYLTE